MKGSKVMAKLSYSQQLEAIATAIKMEIKKINSLSPEEAQKEAHNNLVRIGIIDDDNNLTAPYVALGQKYVQ